MNYIKTLIKPITQALFLNRILWKVKVNDTQTGTFLTFDDGPAPVNTDKILDILKQHQITATFFVTGIQAQKHPEIIKRIHAEGHLLGNHSVNHPFPPNIGQIAYIKEIFANQKIIADTLEVTSYPKLVRPPYGHLGFISTIVLLLSGYKIIMWSRDSEDSYVTTSEALMSSISGITVSNGDILLFHDDYQYTVDALESIVTLLHGNGVKILPLNKYI